MELRSGTSTKTEQMCHICTNSFELIMDRKTGELSTDNGIVRAKKFVNFCSHMAISSEGLPESCPKAEYPICERCELNVETFWHLQKERERVEAACLLTKQDVEKMICFGLSEGIDPTPENSLSFSSANHQVMQLRVRIMQEYANRRRRMTANPIRHGKGITENRTLGQRKTQSSQLETVTLREIRDKRFSNKKEAQFDNQGQPGSSTTAFGTGTIEKTNNQSPNPQTSGVGNGKTVYSKKIGKNKKHRRMTPCPEVSDSSDDDMFELARVRIGTMFHVGAAFYKYAEARTAKVYFECEECSLKISFPRTELGIEERVSLQMMKRHMEENHLETR